MSADLAETIGELRELLCDIRSDSEQSIYGYFCGGDPRTFSPDEESCTEEEIQRWKRDCARAESGVEPIAPMPHCGPGAKGYGLGITMITDRQTKDWAERLERYVDQLEGFAMTEGLL